MIQGLKTIFDQILPGGKVTLRPLEKTDLARSLQWFTDPLVNKYLGQNFKDLTEEREEQWFHYVKYSNQNIIFAIQEATSDTHIGNCGLHKIDLRRKSCGLGIVIGEKNYWGRGFGTDTIKALINFALDDLRLSKIWLDVYTYNHRATKVYKNCGFKLTRVLKKNHLYNGKYWDTFLMEYSKKQGILK